MRLSFVLLSIPLLLPPQGANAATLSVTTGGSTQLYYIPCQGPDYCGSNIIMDSSGNEKATAGNPLRTDPTGTTTQPVSIVGTPAVTTTMQGAVTTNPPSYSTGTNQALSLDVNGNTRTTLPASFLLSSGTTAAGTDPGAGIATLCVNGSPTVGAGQAVALQCASNGALLTSAGTVAQGSTTASQLGMLMQGTYLASAPTYSNGTTNPFTSDIHGNLNVNVAAGSAANSAASATGSAVPANAGYTGLNIAGNNTGWTGTSVSAIRAGDLNLALLNGVAPLLGGGTETGVLRVTLPNNGTGQVSISQATPGTTNGVSPALATTGGWTPLRLPGLTNTAVAIKAAPGQLGMLYCSNAGANWAYVQLFDAAAGSVTVGSTGNVGPIGIAPGQNGGFPLSFPGVQFSTAISAAATTTATGAGAPSPTIDCAVDFT